MNVLMVEDDENLAEDFKLLLPESISLQWASRSEKAIGYLCRRDDFDAIILDLCLPPYLSDSEEHEGLQLLKKIRNSFSESIPVVILTALPREKTEEDCLKLRADVFLQKPCPIDIIVRTLGELTGEHSGRFPHSN